MFTKLQSGLYEFLVFGLKEAQSCIFAGSFFLLLFISKFIPLYGVARYDFLFIAAILLQIVLYLTKVETWDEVKTIFLFHIIGLALEAFKTHPSVGSWSYPEDAFFKIGTVPLFSGFMYAAVGSYFAQAWHIMQAQLVHYPNYILSMSIAALIYLNFFTNHFFYDVRYFLIAAVVVVFWKSKITFVVTEKRRSMPLVLAYALVAFFIWIAENISTFLGAWQYPDQVHVWNAVSTNKITSWFLLVIICFIIVSYLKHYKAERTSVGYNPAQ